MQVILTVQELLWVLLAASELQNMFYFQNRQISTKSLILFDRITEIELKLPLQNLRGRPGVNVINLFFLHR